MLKTTEKTGKKKHVDNEREDWRTGGELLINPLSFTHLHVAQSHGVSDFPARSLSDLHIFCWKSSCRLLEYKRTFFGVVVLVFLGKNEDKKYTYSSPYALRLLCFALFPRLSPWQPWQLGHTSEGFASVLSHWSIWATLALFCFVSASFIKIVLMGTYAPHTCIPGLVWQKQARPFSQFELKVGELGFLIHFVCVSAALYHRGHAAAIFSPQVNMVHFRQSKSYLTLAH